MDTPELLAPANSYETSQTAFCQGADAVYVGVERLNLRARSAEISVEGLSEIIALGSTQARKVYVALNVMPDDRGMEHVGGLLDRIGALATLPNAFIVSDPGVLAICRERLPGVPLHLSTQTGTFNSTAMRFWKTQGISRFILPRELSTEQIAQLNTQNVAETEIFIHGAMCVAISGRCLLGAYLAGRHPNRGDCPQYCRLPYEIRPLHSEHDRTSEWLGVNQSHGEAHLLNSKDLNTLSILPQLISTGVRALKIEGRNKSIHYISSVVKVYRAALDRCMSSPEDYRVDPKWTEELDALHHRPYTTGFYGGDPTMQEIHSAKASAGVQILGVVRERLADGKGVVVDVKHPFAAAEEAGVLPCKDRAPYSFTIPPLSNLNGAPIDRALTNRLVLLAPTSPPLSPGDIIRRAIAKA